MKNKLNHLIASQYFSFFVTVLLFIILYGAGIAIYKGFMRPQVFLNLFIDNAALIIVTVGITFTLIIAGIDLSVGAVLALVCMVLAWLLVHTGIPVGGYDHTERSDLGSTGQLSDQPWCGICFDRCGRSLAYDHRGSDCSEVHQVWSYGIRHWRQRIIRGTHGAAGIPDESDGLCNFRFLLLAWRAGLQSHHADRL